ncbi:MAG: hypothetical protein ACRCTX_27505 [Afipia sp.]
MKENGTRPDEQENTLPIGGSEDAAVQVELGGETVEIEIVDDTPEQDRNRKPLDRTVADPTDEEIDSYSEGVKKRIKELTHARHDERRAKEALARDKEELERLARHFAEENSRLKQYVSEGTQQFADSQTRLATNELEEAKRRLKAATEAFDTDAAVEAQEAMLEAKLKLQAAKNFRPPPLHDTEKEVQTAQQVAQPAQLDERTLRWQARNQWFGAPGLEDMTSFALGLHQKLVNTGVSPSSEEYFEQIDARMQSTFRDFFGTDDRQTPSAGTKRPTTVVAPATRSTGVRKIQLTSRQKALAEKFGLTAQQYAEQVARLEKSNG